MDLVMEFERSNGRIPEDVSLENLGFDIRSKSPENGNVRYIEVKARSGIGAIAPPSRFRILWTNYDGIG